jgi:hypothetical protein
MRNFYRFMRIKELLIEKGQKIKKISIVSIHLITCFDFYDLFLVFLDISIYFCIYLSTIVLLYY